MCDFTENLDRTLDLAAFRQGVGPFKAQATEIPLSWAGILLLVCDGMGGAAAGDLAARIAAEAIKHRLVGAGHATVDSLRAQVKAAADACPAGTN